MVNFNCHFILCRTWFHQWITKATELCEEFFREGRLMTSPKMVAPQPTLLVTENTSLASDRQGVTFWGKASAAWKWKSNETAFSILSCFKSDEFVEENFASVLNRVGLWTINKGVKNLLFLVGKRFRPKTKNEPWQQKINIVSIASALTKGMNSHTMPAKSAWDTSRNQWKNIDTFLTNITITIVMQDPLRQCCLLRICHCSNFKSS